MIHTENLPIVSICCLTYNHEYYLSAAIEGFLMQKTNFSFEIIIHDDASTDKTPEIIKKYSKANPGLIIPIIQKENQYSKGVRGIFTKFVAPKANGRYIALCEGDDYWTDPYKLQKQIEFLDKNTDYSVCVGGYTTLIEKTNEDYVNNESFKANDPNLSGFTFSLKEMQKRWLTKTLTAVIRSRDLEDIDFSRYKYQRDIHLFYHLMNSHKGFYFSEDFGIYRIHEGGINSMQHGQVNHNAAYNCYKELWEVNRDDFTRIMNRRHTLALFNHSIYNKYPGNNLFRCFRLFIEAVKLTRRFRELKYLISALVSSDLKDQIRNYN